MRVYSLSLRRFLCWTEGTLINPEDIVEVELIPI